MEDPAPLRGDRWALATRGLLLAVGIFVARLLPGVRRMPSRALPGAIGAASARLAGALGLAWLGMLALWPFGLLHPLAGPAEAAAATHDFPWHGLVRFAGAWHACTDLPPLAALGGWALSAAAARLPRRGALAALSATAALASLALADAVRLHPYQYLYFNRAVAGGLQGASREHELDYWGATGREAMEWVERNLPPPPSGTRITVGTTAGPSVACAWSSPEARARFAFVSEGVPDLRLATTRWFDHRSTGRVLHVVERMGVPLLYVLDAAIPVGRLVLEAGDRGVVLPAPAGWSGTPDIRLGEERARWELSHAGGGVRAKLTVVTPRTGPVPSDVEVRDAVLRQGGRALGVDPSALGAAPLAGPSATGWYVGGRPAAEGEAAFVLAAARVGDCAVFLAAHGPGAPERVPEEVLEMVRGARLATATERRPP